MCIFIILNTEIDLQKKETCKKKGSLYFGILVS